MRSLDQTVLPVEHMDEVLREALAITDPNHFLEVGDGIHEIEDIYLVRGMPPHPTHPKHPALPTLPTDGELPHPAGVN